MRRRTLPSLTALLLTLLVASALPSAAAQPPGGPLGISLDEGVVVTDAHGQPVVWIDEISESEIVTRAAETVRGAPVSVGVITGADESLEGAQATEDVALGFAASPDGVTLAWELIAGATSYTVHRDGQLLGSVPEPGFIDTDVVPGTSYDYSVRADVLLEPEDVVDPATGEVTNPSRWMGYVLATPVTVPADLGDAVASLLNDGTSLSTASASTGFRYTTFISPSTAPGFPCVKIPTNTYFKGDNRGYSATSTAYRTRMAATMNWSTGKLGYTKLVRSTVNYNNNGTVRDTKTATSANMLFTGISTSSTRASFTLDHSARNPFCTSTGGSIRYVASVSMYKSGAYIMSGWRRPVPHHEAYIRHDATSWKTVLRVSNDGFHCLTGICGTKSIARSGNH